MASRDSDLWIEPKGAGWEEGAPSCTNWNDRHIYHAYYPPSSKKLRRTNCFKCNQNDTFSYALAYLLLGLLIFIFAWNSCWNPSITKRYVFISTHYSLFVKRFSHSYQAITPLCGKYNYFLYPISDVVFSCYHDWLCKCTESDKIKFFFKLDVLTFFVIYLLAFIK